MKVSKNETEDPRNVYPNKTGPELKWVSYDNDEAKRISLEIRDFLKHNPEMLSNDIQKILKEKTKMENNENNLTPYSWEKLDPLVRTPVKNARGDIIGETVTTDQLIDGVNSLIDALNDAAAGIVTMGKALAGLEAIVDEVVEYIDNQEQGGNQND